jgi:hypothetical protein
MKTFTLEDQEAMQTNLDKQIATLAHKGKGAFWIGMVVVSAVFTAIGYLLQAWMSK